MIKTYLYQIQYARHISSITFKAKIFEREQENQRASTR